MSADINPVVTRGMVIFERATASFPTGRVDPPFFLVRAADVHFGHVEPRESVG